MVALAHAYTNWRPRVSAKRKSYLLSLGVPRKISESKMKF